MGINIMRRGFVICLFLTLCTTDTALATNGYFSHGYGTKTKGIGGAGMAISQDSYAPAINPAGIAGMESRLDISFSYFRPERSVTLKDGTSRITIDSDSEDHFIPSFGFVMQIDEDRSVGVALLANCGMNTNYSAFTTTDPNCNADGGGLFCGGSAGIDLKQIALIPTYAQRFMEGRFSIGFSPIISYQQFEAKGLGGFDNPNVSTNPGSVTDQGRDSTWGYGAQIGFQAQVFDNVTLGGSYRTRIRNGDFDDYDGLFTNGGEFDIPSSYGAGIAIRITPNITLAADYSRINYSDIDAVSNPQGNLFLDDGSGLLGGTNGAGFGWRDIDVFKIGLQIATKNNWIWRLGYNRGQNPVRSREVEFNILTPAVIQEHYTAGATKILGEKHELSLSAMYAPEKSLTGPTQGGQGPDATIRMKQFEVEVGYAYLF